jgi:hypothetical protein
MTRFSSTTSLNSRTDYVLSAVMLEFGGRSTGEPFELRPIHRDAAAHLPGLEFPEARPR